MTEGVTYIIKNDAGVQALLGLNKAGVKYKVFPGLADVIEQWPYSVVKILSKVPYQCKDNVPERFKYTFAVITYDINYLQCQEIDKAIFWALSGVTGIHNGVNFIACGFDNLRDEFVQLPSSQYLHAKVSTYEAIVNEGQAT